MQQDLKDILLTEEQLQAKIRELGAKLSEDYRDRNPLVICVLKGAFIFMADLVKNISIPIEIDFMAVSSYGSSTKSSGVVRIIKDLEVSVEGRDVIIVEDIIDSGLTLSWLMRNLKNRNPKSLNVITLLRKPERLTANIDMYDIGFDIPNEFVVGYGLDFTERYRDLPYVGTLEPRVYSD